MAAARGRNVTPAAAAGPAWSPTDLASLVAWWDFSDATTLFTDAGTTPVASDGDRIYRANDKSGNGFYQQQATSGNRPAYKVGIQNGKSAAYLDAARLDAMTSASVAGQYPGNAATVFIAFTPDNDLAYTVLNTNSSDTWWRFDGDGKAYMGVYRSTRIDAAYSAESSGDLLYAIASDNSAYKVWSGGTSKLSTTGAFNADVTVSLSNDVTRPFSGWVYEVVICNAVLSTADMNTLGAYLGTKWALTWSDIP